MPAESHYSFAAANRAGQASAATRARAKQALLEKQLERTAKPSKAAQEQVQGKLNGQGGGGGRRKKK